MQFTERKRIQLCGSPGSHNYFGLIELLHLAKPETVHVTVLGETWIPERFNLYGEPIFSEEATLLFDWKEDEIRHSSRNFDFLLTAEVSYEEACFPFSRDEFDSTDGIYKAIKDLDSFTNLLNQRRMWKKVVTTNEHLHEFVVFGKYILDQFGQVLQIQEETVSCSAYPVCPRDFFDFHVPHYSASFSSVFPTPDSICPCCGRSFTIHDLQTTTFKMVNDKVAHESCYRNFYHQKEIAYFTDLMDLVYPDHPTFELLPNGYCSDSCCSHIPWFLFHTSDGDIVIGNQKRVISIEWQENFKPFDMKLFIAESVTKWQGLDPTAKRGIHAWGKEKAILYLKQVKDLVASSK